MAIRLYWWSMQRDDQRENYGDLLSQYLIEKISGRNIKHILNTSSIINKYIFKHYLAIGSIIKSANQNSVVWGSGILKRYDKIGNANLFAVRGPITRKRVLECGNTVPKIYGDPALLLPEYYNPKLEKKYDYGVVPHYSDYDDIKSLFDNDPRIKIIDIVTNDIESKTDEILRCKNIVSSSLHGVIVGHAYNIPSLWVKFSNNPYGDNVKYYDYYKSLEMEIMEEPELKPMDINYENLNSLTSRHKKLIIPPEIKIEGLKNDLMETCPFI